MIARYTRPAMHDLWSEKTKFRLWRDVEVALVQELEARGVASDGAARALEAQPVPTPERVAEIERTTNHDVIAFLTAIAEGMGAERKWVHYGMTSTDLVDTAQALRIRASLDEILSGVDGVLERLRALALRHKSTPMIGRTHGVHAEVMTLGMKFLSAFAEFRRNRVRLERAGEGLAVGKLSGAVGTCPHLSPDVEAAVLARLSLAVEPIATQVVPRDRHGELMTSLALLGGTMERVATEIRHLHRTEVGEVCEGFAPGQKGSSAMPHKRNPITCERIAGLSRVLRGNATAALENMALWHERDITHSSVERIILPDSLALADYMLSLLTTVLDRLDVRVERIAANLADTRGLVFSGHVLLALTDALDNREAAYDIVQRNAMACWQEGGNLRERLRADSDVLAVLTAEAVDRLFDPEHALRHVDAIFDRTLSP